MDNKEIYFNMRHYFFLSRELWDNMNESCDWICNLYRIECDLWRDKIEEED